MMEWVYDDGGRAAAGFRGQTGDCGVRSIAIVTGEPYRAVYDEANAAGKRERMTKKRRVRGRSSGRDGIWPETLRRMMEARGWRWVATMGIGTGCRVHLRADELPAGRLLVRLSGHYSAVVDGVIRDTWDPSREGSRCVYGYYVKDGA